MSSSSSKTEKPTPKKKQDAAKEGQTFKSKDLITTCLMLVGIEVMLNYVSIQDLAAVFHNIIRSHYDISPHDFAVSTLLFGLKILAPVLVMGIAATVLPGLLQTGLRIASKILKLKFDALNPVKGIKKLFSMRTIKELIKALLYIGSFIVAAIIFWYENRSLLMHMVYGDAKFSFAIWGELIHSLLIIFIICIAIIVLMDCISEFFLYIKELKMDKKEVEREKKESDGNPKIKSRRRELHQELLSEETKSAVKKSSAVIVNPTHIAVGIYLNAEVTILPFISLIETDAKALAVRRYAKKVGVPVVENITLARALFASHKVHMFVSLEFFTPVLDILVWLEAFELSWLNAPVDRHQGAQQDKHETAADKCDVPPASLSPETLPENLPETDAKSDERSLEATVKHK